MTFPFRRSPISMFFSPCPLLAKSGWSLALLRAQAQASEKSGPPSLATRLQLSTPPSFSARDQSTTAHARPFWLPSTTGAFSRSSSILGTISLQVAALPAEHHKG
ncbi:hypothetical protein BDW68DRAFT_171065 [Aspergillus falconensis]